MTTPWDGRGLPPVAAARLARASSDGLKTSLLSVPSTMADEVVGLEPVGEVMGCCVHHLGWQGWGGCGAYGYGSYGNRFAMNAFSGGGVVEGFAPYTNAVRHGYGTAMSRLEAEARALGAHGVIDIRITVERMDGDTYEFVCMGTAVVFRDQGAPHPGRKLFLTDLPGVDVAKLLLSGWLPANVVFGISVGVRHDDWTTQRQASFSSWNTEVSGFTELVSTVRNGGRRDLTAQASGADGVLMTSQSMRIWEQEPSDGHRDHVAECRMFGTALLRLEASAKRHPAVKPLSILPLRSFTSGRWAADDPLNRNRSANL